MRYAIIITLLLAALPAAALADHRGHSGFSFSVGVGSSSYGSYNDFSFGYSQGYYPRHYYYPRVTYYRPAYYYPPPVVYVPPPVYYPRPVVVYPRYSPCYGSDGYGYSSYGGSSYYYDR